MGEQLPGYDAWKTMSRDDEDEELDAAEERERLKQEKAERELDAEADYQAYQDAVRENYRK